MDDTEEVEEDAPEEDTLKSLACLLGKVEGCSVSVGCLQAPMVLGCYYFFIFSNGSPDH